MIRNKTKARTTVSSRSTKMRFHSDEPAAGEVAEGVFSFGVSSKYFSKAMPRRLYLSTYEVRGYLKNAISSPAGLFIQ
jgi:hypothetical protein